MKLAVDEKWKWLTYDEWGFYAYTKKPKLNIDEWEPDGDDDSIELDEEMFNFPSKMKNLPPKQSIWRIR